MKQFYILLFLCLTPVFLLSQGKVFKSLEMNSELLNTQIKYSVYLPENYNVSTEYYPVVYLLNGLIGNELSWIQDGDIKKTMDTLIKNNSIAPMVIVMPDGDDRLYMNKDDGTYPYEDMFFSEFLPFIENTYRIKGKKKFRAISGLSMGGSGSLRWAFLYPNLFGTCAAFSAGISIQEEIINEPQDSFDYYFGRISPSVVGKKGKHRLTETVSNYNILKLIETLNPEDIRTVNIYFDCGDDDFLTVGNSELHISLTKKNIPHEFRMRDGTHTWEFWRDSLPEGLKFINNVMNLN